MIARTLPNLNKVVSGPNSKEAFLPNKWLNLNHLIPSQSLQVCIILSVILLKNQMLDYVGFWWKNKNANSYKIACRSAYFGDFV